MFLTKGSLIMGNESRFGPSHRWRVLGIGVAANAAVAAAFGGIPATAVFIRNGYQLDNSIFGWVIGAMGLGIAVSELPWGLVTDWLGDRKVLLTGLSLTGVVLVLMASFVSPTAEYVPAAAFLGSAFCSWAGLGEA
jgi:predicted MFS family arabinose efflux permease